VSGYCIKISITYLALLADPAPWNHLPAAFPLHLDIQAPHELLTVEATGAFHNSTVASSNAFRTFKPFSDKWSPQAGHFMIDPTP